MPRQRSAVFKASALLLSLLLAGWYLHFRATGNAWITTRAAEGATDLAGGSPAGTPPGPATKPTTILPGSKSAAVFPSRTVQYTDGTHEFPAQPAAQSTPSTEVVRLHNDSPTVMTAQDVRMSSSKSIVVFDSKDAAAQAAKERSLNAAPTAPAAASAAQSPAATVERSTLLSSSKSAPIFTPPPDPKAASQPAPAPPAPPAPAHK